MLFSCNLRALSQVNQFTPWVFVLSSTGPENLIYHCEWGGLAQHRHLIDDCINAISGYVVSIFQDHVRLRWKFLRTERKFLIFNLLVVSEEIAIRMLKEKCWKCWRLNWKEFIFTWIQRIYLIWPFSVKIRAWSRILKSNMTKTWKTFSCLCVLMHDGNNVNQTGSQQILEANQAFPVVF